MELATVDGEPGTQAYDPSDWWMVEVEVTPAAPTGPFTHWQPSDIGLSGRDAAGEDIDVHVSGVEVFSQGDWMPDMGEKLSGPQRLRFHAGMTPETTTITLRYYLEELGTLDLPRRASDQTIDAEP